MLNKKNNIYKIFLDFYPTIQLHFSTVEWANDTTSILNFASATAGDEGSYYCKVTYDEQSFKSEERQLYVRSELGLHILTLRLVDV